MYPHKGVPAMSWTFNKKKNAKGETYYVHVSFRKNGKVTSANCGAIHDIEKIREEKGDGFDAFVNSEADRIYKEWIQGGKTKHIFTLREDVEQENARNVYASQIYLRKVWNMIGLERELDSLKSDKHMKFKFDLNEVVFFLASRQVIESSSKLRSYLARDEFILCPEDMTLDSLYDCLDVIADNADSINLRTYRRARKYLGKESRLYFYDVTSVNMSKSVKTSDLIGMKKGKEGIFGPIIQIGYLCDEWGLIVGILVFKGNRNEQGSLKEQITNVFGAAHLKDIVICTDAGLCSTSNKRLCSKAFKGYIATQPITKRKVPETVRKWALEEKFRNGDTCLTKEEIIKRYEDAVDKGDEAAAASLLNTTFYKSKWFVSTVRIGKSGKEEMGKAEESEAGKSHEDAGTIKESELKPKGKTSSVSFEQRMVASFNLRYYLSQKADLDEAAAKAMEAVKNGEDVKDVPTKDYRRFVKAESCTADGEPAAEKAMSFEQDQYDYELSLCGVYCQATNLDDDESVIYGSSRGRWIIEYLFRTGKTHFGMSNVYLHTEKHIKGHFELIALATNMLLTLVYKIYLKMGNGDDKLGRLRDQPLSLTLDRVLDEISNLKSAVAKDDSGNLCLVSLRSKNEINKAMSDTFGFSLTTQVRPQSDIKKLLS